jgi:hypothetical protein
LVNSSSSRANTTGLRDGLLAVTLIFLTALVPTWMPHRAQQKAGR